MLGGSYEEDIAQFIENIGDIDWVGGREFDYSEPRSGRQTVRHYTMTELSRKLEYRISVGIPYMAHVY